MATKKTAKGRGVRAVEVGVGIAGALAGAYLLYKHTKPQQKKAKEWVLKAQKAAGIEAKKLSSIGEKEYQRIILKAIQHYGAIHKVGGVEVAAAIKDAKAEWKHIQAVVKKARKVAPAKKKTGKRSVKKATRKAVKK